MYKDTVWVVTVTLVVLYPYSNCQVLLISHTKRSPTRSPETQGNWHRRRRGSDIHQPGAPVGCQEKRQGQGGVVLRWANRYPATRYEWKDNQENNPQQR